MDPSGGRKINAKNRGYSREIFNHVHEKNGRGITQTQRHTGNPLCIAQCGQSKKVHQIDGSFFLLQDFFCSAYVRNREEIIGHIKFIAAKSKKCAQNHAKSRKAVFS